METETLPNTNPDQPPAQPAPLQGDWAPKGGTPWEGHESVAEQEELRYGFRAGRLNFLFQHNEDTELLKNPKVYPLPKSPPYFKGLINLRGGIVSVFNLKQMLLDDSSTAAERNVLVLGKNDKAVGVIIDDLPKSLRVTAESFSPPGEDHLQEVFTKIGAHIRGSYIIDGQRWIEFDTRSFLLRHVGKNVKLTM